MHAYLTGIVSTMAVDTSPAQQKSRIAEAASVSSAWLRPMSVREIALAWTTLAIVGALAFMPHVMHGGFYLDDWSIAADTLYPSEGGQSFGDALARFNDVLSSCRPVLIVFFPLKYFLFGTHMKFLLVFSVLLALIVAALLYAVLRLLGVLWYHAWLIAALTVVYPWFDSTRFWESASPISLALIFALAGLWLALIGLSRQSWRLHGCAALLYLLSMLTYETTLPIIASAGLIYLARAGWQAARLRWAVDLMVVVIAGLWSVTHTPRTVSSVSGDITHLGEIVVEGGALLGHTALPLAARPHTMLVVGALTGVMVVGLAFYLLSNRPQGDRDYGRGMRQWLLLGLAGMLIAALGWVTFIPADPYYTPSIFGFTNRVNGVAGFGLILAVYSAFGVVGMLLGRLLRGARWIPATTTLLFGVMLGMVYTHVLERHSDLWTAAFRTEMVTVGAIKTKFPHLPHGATVIASGGPAYQTLGVPVFAATWDLNGMVRLQYKDGTLRAYPVTEELKAVCRARGLGIESQDEITPLIPYRTVRLLDVPTGATDRPRNRRECAAVIDSYPPGPLYLSTTY